MLTKVILENFRSFKNKTVFDLESSKYQILQDRNVKNGILKSALIVGPNATGKSTLIIAIRTLLDMLFRDNFTMRAFDSCLFCHKNNIHLEYHFTIDTKKIKYYFETDKNGNIVIEDLTIDDDKIIERKMLSGRVNINNKTTKIMDKLFSNKVLLLRKCYFSDVFATMPTINKLMEFLHFSVYVDASQQIAHSYNNISHLIQESDQNVIDEINSTFKSLNIGFRISKSKENKISEINDKNGRVQSYSVKSEEPIIFFQRNDMKLNLPLEMESLGNQTLINMFPSVLYCCQHKCLLLIDEFSSGFHNMLEELIVKYFLLNSKESQLIFTSHSTNLLNTKLLRPDQIYTVDFEPNEGSFIERFSDENPREAQNLEKMYLSGKFGSIPDYNL
ncbi:MAG: AAA family ATPase [Clostridia bacterium]|nr:AAA family ATPase [Clostridia bacterium]